VRILVCSSEQPIPPLNGLRLQLTAVLRELAPRHEITVVGSRWPEQEGERLQGMEAIDLPPPEVSRARRARGWLASTARGLPSSTTVITPPLAQAASELLARRAYDVAYVTGPSMASVVPALGDVPAVLGALDAWHLNVAAEARVAPWVMRPLYRLEALHVRRFGARFYPAYRAVVAVTAEDADAIRAIAPGVETAVVPNGVDTALFSPGGAAEPGHVVLTGAMGYPPNVAAAEFLAEEVMPEVRARRPDARLSLVGRAPSRRVLALDRHPGVDVVGEVPDIVPWLRRADVYACPMLSGTGIKNKLLEALACGAPVVATPLACQGMDVLDGEHVLMAEGADVFAQAIVRVLDDRALRDALSQSGRRYVGEEHRWAAAARRLEHVLCDAAGDDR
jgi:polysaccharide biosynthesis protein PslH